MKHQHFSLYRIVFMVDFLRVCSGTSVLFQLKQATVLLLYLNVRHIRIIYFDIWLILERKRPSFLYHMNIHYKPLKKMDQIWSFFFSKDECETLWDITVRNILILLNYKNDTQNYGQILNKYFVDWSSKDKIFLLLNSVSGSQRPWVISTQNISRTINNIWVFCHFSFQQKHWLWIIQFPLVSILSRGGGINCDAD